MLLWLVGWSAGPWSLVGASKLTWELAMCYRATQVVVKVVGRMNLGDNLPPEESEAVCPLSREDRDLRLAELMSLGVELPREKLVALLR